MRKNKRNSPRSTSVRKSVCQCMFVRQAEIHDTPRLGGKAHPLPLFGPLLSILCFVFPIFYFFIFVKIQHQHHCFIGHSSRRVWIVSSSLQFRDVLCSAFAHRSQQWRQQQRVQRDDMQITRMQTNLQISTATLTTIHHTRCQSTWVGQVLRGVATYYCRLPSHIGSESFARLSGRCN